MVGYNTPTELETALRRGCTMIFWGKCMRPPLLVHEHGRRDLWLEQIVGELAKLTTKIE
jgi:hypothetical protein